MIKELLEELPLNPCKSLPIEDKAPMSLLKERIEVQDGRNQRYLIVKIVFCWIWKCKLSCSGWGHIAGINRLRLRFEDFSAIMTKNEIMPTTFEENSKPQMRFQPFTKF